MIILGLHFGHDASVSIIKDGEVLLCYELERHKRIKKIIGIEYQDILNALFDCDIKEKNIDFVTVSSTQLVEYIFPEPNKLNIKFGQLNSHYNYPCSLKNQLNISDEEFVESGIGWVQNVLRDMPTHPYHRFLKDNFKETILNTNNYEKTISTKSA